MSAPTTQSAEHQPLQQTKEQERASKAWECVTTVETKSHKGKYRAWVMKFPMLVLTNGLGHALAFLRAKNKPEHADLYAHISTWVTKEIYADEGDDKLLERIIGVKGYERASDSNTYRRATTESLAFASWLKRFAEAKLPDEKVD